jgi:general secretion pathway protein I
MKANRHGYDSLGFTLIEVLLALAIIAIALTALFKASAQDVAYTARVKDKTIAHWVAMQAVSMIQLKLVDVNQLQENTQTLTMLGENWYWRANVNSTPVRFMQQIVISVSKQKQGPFTDPLIAFRYGE